MAIVAKPASRFTGERLGISLVFFLAGLWYASWVGRLSVIGDVFDFSSSGLGAFLACLTAGSLVGLSVAPMLIRRFSIRNLLFYLPLALAIGLLLMGLSISTFVEPVLAYVVLLGSGIIFGTLDVAMNVYGGGVERRQGHSILPSLHGFFSLGTLLGAGAATATISLQWPSLWHFSVISLIIAALAVWSTTLVADETPTPAPTPVTEESWSSNAASGRYTRYTLLLLGLMVAGLSFTEGAANDWLAVATNTGHGFSHSLGALVFTLFVAAMTLGRFTGGQIVDRLGSVRALLLMGGIGLFGVALFIAGDSAWSIGMGALFWGLGSSLGFPVGMSIAASHSKHLGPRAVSIVSGFGYGAMLSGPPLIGLLGDHIGILPALWLPALVMLGSLLLTPIVGKPARREAKKVIPAAEPGP